MIANIPSPAATNIPMLEFLIVSHIVSRRFGILEEGVESYSPSLTKKHGKTEAIPPKQLCRPQPTGKRMKRSAALRFAKRLIHCSYAVFALQLHFRRVIRGNFLSDIVLGGIELPWRLRHRKLLQMTDPALHAFRDRMDTSLIDIVGSFLAR